MSSELPEGERRKSDEERLRSSSEKAIEGSQGALRTIFDNTHDAIFVHSVDGRILDVNQKMLDLYRVTREEALGMSIAEDFSTEENPLDELGTVWARVIGGEPTVFEWRAKRPGDGTAFDVEVALQKIDLGEREVVLANVRDITHRKREQEEKARLAEQLRQAQKMEAIGRLAGGIAHDFNNILTGIIGNAELLQLSPGVDAPDREQIAEIHRAAQRAAGLVSQLLAFSRKQVIAPRVIQPNDVLASAQGMLARTIGEDIALTFRAAEDLWRIRADPTQLDQILMNLAVNARDAMPGGGSLTFETRNVQLDEEFCRAHEGCGAGDYVMISVADTGVGMEAETLEHVFEPFFTTKKGEGTGLGLATVYGVIRQNGGLIEVHSAAGEGTRFDIYFPAVQDVREEPPAAGAVPRASKAETILVVEDEELVRRIAQAILTRNGYRVVESASGEEALDYCESCDHELDLLLTDVVLPAMNGRELSEALKKRWPGLRTLYMSGYTDDVIAQRGILEKGTRFLQKPFTIRSLANRVREVLDGPTDM